MLEKIKSSNERVLWHSKTNRLLYTLGNPIFILFGLIWGAIDLMIFLFMRNVDTVHGTVTTNGISRPAEFPFSPFLLIFLLVHSLPFWLVIISLIVRFFSSKNVEYMMTDLRIYLVSGLFGKDVTNIEYREVKNLTVNVNPIQNMLGLGTVILTPDSVHSDGGTSRRGIRILHIKDPYDVYAKIKELSLDVTTDQYYPNAMRPKENPGYQTKYKS